MALTDKQKEAYLADPSKCPVCKGSEIYQVAEGNLLTETWHCFDCDITFTLTDVEEVSP